MKALTVLQPWASLIADGFKTVESRSWATNYRGPLAIHASKDRPRYAVEFAETLGEPERRKVVPYGCVVATCILVDVLSTDLSVAAFGAGNAWRIEYEKTLGDYGPGRFAWMLDEIVPLSHPFPVRGALGLWEWPGPLWPR